MQFVIGFLSGIGLAMLVIFFASFWAKQVVMVEEHVRKERYNLMAYLERVRGAYPPDPPAGQPQ